MNDTRAKSKILATSISPTRALFALKYNSLSESNRPTYSPPPLKYNDRLKSARLNNLSLSSLSFHSLANKDGAQFIIYYCRFCDGKPD